MMRTDKAVSIDLGPVGCVRMLRPTHPKDGLFIQYSAHDLGIVIKFLRDSGFDESLAYIQKPGLPKGVHTRKGSMVVQYTKVDGTKGYKKCPDMDAVSDFMSSLDEQPSGLEDDGAHTAVGDDIGGNHDSGLLE